MSNEEESINNESVFTVSTASLQKKQMERSNRKKLKLVTTFCGLVVRCLNGRIRQNEFEAEARRYPSNCIDYVQCTNIYDKNDRLDACIIAYFETFDIKTVWDDSDINWPYFKAAQNAQIQIGQRMAHLKGLGYQVTPLFKRL